MRLAAIVSLTILALLAASAAQTPAARSQSPLMVHLLTNHAVG
ncbi:MAG: hypothetical protein P0Y65_18465 [Candidatus Devosia phytovorans]|uniref:Uncharacterized protein n=1 Tax=Candidatus Devosia phytovorans TaxID=3121372 RepID=A0AAJ5VU01_9HYPH|nr:hypothetical protein [Devosia sp.]WEK04141.1 MAG: hypothetical protein P0Y65_18465 [Devosia sp.]